MLPSQNSYSDLHRGLPLPTSVYLNPFSITLAPLEVPPEDVEFNSQTEQDPESHPDVNSDLTT